MTIRVNGHRPRGRVTHRRRVETERARLLILSGPARHPNRPTKNER
jgi:hypothetical protein